MKILYFTRNDLFPTLVKILFMGIFDFLFGKKAVKQQQSDTPQNIEHFGKVPAAKDTLKNDTHKEKVEILPGLSISKVLVKYWPEIEKTKRPYISITATPGMNLSSENSHFGYYPCIPVDFDYPKDSAGLFMFPLAQINCKELPPLEGYPNSGYLQFYISAFDEVYGLDFENPTIAKRISKFFILKNLKLKNELWISPFWIR